MDMWLPKYDIYQGKVAANCFKSHTYSFFFLMFCLMSVLKFTLPDVTSFLLDIVSRVKQKLYADLNFLATLQV